MHELKTTLEILQMIGWPYRTLVLGLVGLTLWFPQGWHRKAIGALVVALVLVIPAYLNRREAYLLASAQKARFEKAKALFAERCKRSGVTIHRKVENVEGIYLMKLRSSNINFDNQYRLDDPYGHDFSGEGYIQQFLKGSYEAETKSGPSGPIPPKGFKFVDAVDPKDAIRYRYSGFVEEPALKSDRYLKGYFRFVMQRSPAVGEAPRYGLTYEDISTKLDRDYWIAGSSLRVIDLLTNDVMAERIGYMMDWAQGSKGGGRAPWLLAARNACPEFSKENGALTQLGQAQRFVEEILVPQE